MAVNLNFGGGAPFNTPLGGGGAELAAAELVLVPDAGNVTYTARSGHLTQYGKLLIFNFTFEVVLSSTPTNFLIQIPRGRTLPYLSSQMLNVGTAYDVFSIVLFPVAMFWEPGPNAGYFNMTRDGNTAFTATPWLFGGTIFCQVN